MYRDADNNRFKEYVGGDRASKTQWHSDIVSLIAISHKSLSDLPKDVREAAPWHDYLLHLGPAAQRRRHAFLVTSRSV